MLYTFTRSKIPDLLMLEPKVSGDSQDFFFEFFNPQDFNKVTGLDVKSVRDNYRRCTQGVLRSLQYQRPEAQGELLPMVRGSGFGPSAR